jgi:hypothetical protein
MANPINNIVAPHARFQPAENSHFPANNDGKHQAYEQPNQNKQSSTETP